MGNSKLIIRLIDIVFILLFAFISVSQIDTLAVIDPPKSTEATMTAPQGTYTEIIGVSKDGSYLVDNGARALHSAAALRRYLITRVQELEEAKKQLGVRIRANWDSPVEYGIRVADICSELGLQKGLDVVQYRTH